MRHTHDDLDWPVPLVSDARISRKGGDIPLGRSVESGSDAELLAAARQGDAQALEALLVRYQGHLYRFGLRMCGNTDDAGDVAQESLMAMARSMGDFRGDSSISSWLYTIARRFCLRRRRRRKFAPRHEDSLDAPGGDTARHLADPAPGPEQTAAGREIEAVLTAAIDALEPGQREVLLLRDVEGLSAPEVARVLGISAEAVKSRLHRARLGVRQHVAPLLGAPLHAPRTPPCPDVLTLFSRYLEGEIDRTVCAQMEAHLAQCPHCRGACESLKRSVASCRELATPEVPAPVAASIKTAIRKVLSQR